MKSNLQKNQDHASNVDHISRVDEQKLRSPSNKFQNFKKFNNSCKFQQKNHRRGQFPTGTKSFQASQQIKAGDDISLSVNTVKHFVSKIDERFTFSKNETPCPIPDIAINKVLETITSTNDNHTEQSQYMRQLMKKICPASLTNTPNLMSPKARVTIYR